MNARNDLTRPPYFIPILGMIRCLTRADSYGVSAMLRQTVNDNAKGSITFRSLFTLVEASIRSFSISGSSKLFCWFTRL